MAKGDYTSRARPIAVEADTPASGFVTLYSRESAEKPAGEWFFKGSNGQEFTLRGEPGAPTVVLSLTDLDDTSEIISRLNATAGTVEGDQFALIDANEPHQTCTYRWFTDTFTNDEHYIVAGVSGTFVAEGPRWVQTRITSNDDRNQLRHFYTDYPTLTANVSPADWHGILPAHTHQDGFGNIVGQWWSVHSQEFIEFLTTSNHSGTLYTSLQYGGELSVEGSDNTKFQIAAGRGYIVDFTTPSAVVPVQNVFWDQFDNQTVILSDLFTSIAIDWDNATGIASVIKASGRLFTPEEHRKYIILGTLNHGGSLNITSTQNLALPSYNFNHAVMDYIRSAGGIISDNLSLDFPNSNLTMATTSGTFTLPFINHVNDPLNPAIITHNAATPILFGYNYQDGGGGWTSIFTTVADPNNYDTGAGSLTSVPSNKWTIQPDFLFPNSNFHIFQYGQNLYDTKEEAKLNINTEMLNVLRNPNLVTGVIRGYLIMQEGLTDLSSETSKFEYVKVINNETVSIDGVAFNNTLNYISGEVAANDADINYLSGAIDNISVIDTKSIHVSSNYNAVNKDFVLMTTGNTDKNVVLPAASGNVNAIIDIQKIDSGDGAINLSGYYNGEQINGENTVIIPYQYNSLTVHCDGNVWYKK